MFNSVKVSLFICFLYVFDSNGQSPYETQGKFAFRDTLTIPAQYEIGPGQLNKNGTAYLVGLISGNLEDQVDLKSDLYHIYLNRHTQTSPPEELHLPNPPDSLRIFQATASDNEEQLVFVVNAYSGWNDNELAIAVKDGNNHYSKIQPLSGLNDPIQSDAYPWLSGDGLRLYFTRNYTLMYSERTSTENLFESPVPVVFTGSVQLEIVSVWLSPNEKTLFLIGDNRIYKATRSSRSKPFSLPELFTDEFKDFYFVSGLSFCPDKKNMYIYHTDGETHRILHYILKKGKAW